jgi:diguanylate cyclase (GGDEF)-like protein
MLDGSSASGVMPRTRAIRWLVETGRDVPADIRERLVQSLYGTLPIFVGGVINTIAIAVAIAIRNPSWPFILWAAFELLLAAIRIPVLILGRQAIARGEAAPTDLYLSLGACWAATVGYGSFISLASGDWVAAGIAGISAAAMVGGICFRYYGAPRLVGLMIALSLTPCAVGGALSGETILLIACLQLPLYMVAMTMAAWQLHTMLVRTMAAEQESARRAQLDVLTGLLNRAGLEHALAVRGTGRTPLPSTIFYIDLDGFKGVNDTFGHGVGDAVLRAVGERLRDAVRPSDIVARLGGDEFLVVTDHRDRVAARRTGDRLVAALSDLPYAIGDEAALIGACVGIAMRPEDGEDFASLIDRADAALYEAKASGGARCVLHPIRGRALHLVPTARAQ